MAAGVPVVTTDVGDSALLIGEAGWIVPPEDSDALASATDEVLPLSPGGRRAVGEQGRERLRQHFSLEGMVESYEEFYEGMAGAASEPEGNCRAAGR